MSAIPGGGFRSVFFGAFHRPERRKAKPMTKGTHPETALPYQKPEIPQAKVTPSSRERPMRQATPSSRATARFSFEWPEPLISAKDGGRRVQPSY